MCAGGKLNRGPPPEIAGAGEAGGRQNDEEVGAAGDAPGRLLRPVVRVAGGGGEGRERRLGLPHRLPLRLRRRPPPVRPAGLGLQLQEDPRAVQALGRGAAAKGLVVVLSGMLCSIGSGRNKKHCFCRLRFGCCIVATARIFV